MVLGTCAYVEGARRESSRLLRAWSLCAVLCLCCANARVLAFSHTLTGRLCAHMNAPDWNLKIPDEWVAANRHGQEAQGSSFRTANVGEETGTHLLGASHLSGTVVAAAAAGPSQDEGAPGVCEWFDCMHVSVSFGRSDARCMHVSGPGSMRPWLYLVSGLEEHGAAI